MTDYSYYLPDIALTHFNLMSITNREESIDYSPSNYTRDSTVPTCYRFNPPGRSPSQSSCWQTAQVILHSSPIYYRFNPPGRFPSQSSCWQTAQQDILHSSPLIPVPICYRFYPPGRSPSLSSYWHTGQFARCPMIITIQTRTRKDDVDEYYALYLKNNKKIEKTQTIKDACNPECNTIQSSKRHIKTVSIYT